MSFSHLHGFKVAGVSTCVPPQRVDNLEAGHDHGAVEVRKVVAMAGVRYRHVVTSEVTAVDLCTDAARRLLDQLGWTPESVTGLIMVTQSPDYFLPSSSCVVHARLGLGVHCAAFDVGLGCSGYPYGLYLAATMLSGGGQQRILVLHGETPSRFVDPQDHATTLLFGDAGSATALEYTGCAQDEAWFGLFTDGRGADSLIVRGGAFRDPTPANPRDLKLAMDGASVFNFTIKRVPAMIQDTLAYAGLPVADIDAFIFHQSNRFIMKHLIKKCELPEDRVPFILEDMGNCGGPSVPLTLTRSLAQRGTQPLRMMLLGYGVGLSWGAAIMTLDANTPLLHHVYPFAPHKESND
ncbi:MAG: ketoacyl-ACP synthase III [Burkholderiales bacterium]|nr:ketoacyl-ACP synthase III [Burkholderiales bacterium]